MEIRRFKSKVRSIVHTKQIAPGEGTAEEVSFEWSHIRISFNNLKVRTTD